MVIIFMTEVFLPYTNIHTQMHPHTQLSILELGFYLIGITLLCISSLKKSF